MENYANISASAPSNRLFWLSVVKGPLGNGLYKQQIGFWLNGDICFPKCIRRKLSSSEHVFIKDWSGVGSNKKKKASRFSCEIVFCSYELNTLSEKFQKETGKNVFALILCVEQFPMTNAF